MNTDREDAIIEAFTKIAELPDGEIKKALGKEMSEQLTTREATELIGVLYQEAGQADTHVFIAVILALYEALEIPLDVPTKDLDPALKERFEEVTPLMTDFGQLVRKITNVLKPEP